MSVTVPRRLEGENLVAPKAVSIVSLILISLLGFGLSKVLKGSERLFNMGNAVAAGVMLSATLVHLLPHAAEELEEWSVENLNGFPIAYVLCACVFLLLLFFDKALNLYVSKQVIPCDGKTSSNSGEESSPLETNDCQHDHSHGLMDLRSIKEYKALILIAAINFHAVMEGLGVGAARDAGTLWSIFVALISHKGLEALAVGNACISADATKVRFWVYGFVFSLATPLGIAIGWVIENSDDAAENLAARFCTALAAGTFLWATMMEFVPHVYESPKDFWTKTVCLVGGFTAMTVIAIWA